MEKKGNENIPNIEFDLEVMDKLFHNENWTKQPNKWSSWADCVKENLSALETKELKKVKWKTQANLQYCEQHSENTVITHGLPMGSFLFGILSIIISLLPNGSGVEVSKIACWLAFWSMVIVAIFAYCERLRKKRKKEIIYYQTLLNIIESIEKEKAKDEDNNK